MLPRGVMRYLPTPAVNNDHSMFFGRDYYLEKDFDEYLQS